MTDIGSGSTLILGVGNPMRGDDAIGRIILQALREHHREALMGCELVELGGEPADILECLKSAQTAVLIDACVSGASPGTVLRHDVNKHALPQDSFAMSSHGLGLHDAIELARALDALPQRCIVVAIEGINFEHGAPLSAEVANAQSNAIARILSEIRSE